MSTCSLNSSQPAQVKVMASQSKQLLDKVLFDANLFTSTAAQFVQSFSFHYLAQKENTNVNKSPPEIIALPSFRPWHIKENANINPPEPVNR